MELAKFGRKLLKNGQEFSVENKGEMHSMVKHKISLFYELVAVFMKAITYIVVGHIILSFSIP